MTYAILDVETTTFQKGSPFAERNKLCFVGIRIGEANHIFKIEYDSEPYAAYLAKLAELLHSVDTVVGFNLKFDLSWLQRFGIKLEPRQSVYDCQLVEFILSNQQERYPSLDAALARYNLGEKLHVVENEYWNQGIDTTEVPIEILYEYLAKDLELTDALFRHQQRIIPPTKERLIYLCNSDLRVLQEMEFNGILFDWAGIERAAGELQPKIEECERGIGDYYEHWPHFNLNSGDHLSALLYGGTVSVDVAIPETRIAVSGASKGQSITRNKWHTESKTFPRLVTPLAGSELAKEGFWSTDQKILQQLKKPKKLLALLRQLADLYHLRDTYYVGLKKLRDKMDWTDGFVHGLLNQCVVITGRLSSAKPNQQNFDSRIHQFITTRF